MSWNTEIAIYASLFFITTGLAVVVYSVLELNKRAHDRITTIRSQLMAAIYSGSTKEDTLQGDIDIIHPKTGEKLHAKARFKVKNKK
jgi:hypothetical protein